ncbi:MAG TPA: hypothetical protein VGB76_12545, partial [Pyrinomonadaceae bacterium]
AVHALALHSVCLMSFVTVQAFAESNAKEAGRAANAALSAQAQEKAKDKKDAPVVPEAELTAAKAIGALTDVQAVIAAASEFLTKYPKSALRPQLAPLVAERIGLTADPVQQIAQAQSYLKIFNAPGEADHVNPHLLAAYTSANRLDEAFALASTALDKSPDPLVSMINLTRGGLEEARKGNLKYIAQSEQYGLKAIDMIESSEKPAAVPDATWADYKTRWLPQLYQWLAMISLQTGDRADAKAKLATAVKLNPLDPINYVVMSSMANDEYQRLAQAHKAATGAEKAELFKKAQAQMDEVIDAYAHAIALAEGNPQYDGLRAQIRPDLEEYYKYRHNNSTEGLQALIDKYKKR